MGIEELNGKRMPLGRKLPLSIPYSISVTTANICNLSCEFCAISEKGRKRNKPLMDYETFRMAVDSLAENSWRLKQMVLVGLGEPLVNPDIVRFVSYIKDRNVADKVHIVTNGVLMTNEMSDRLLEAGVDVIRISVNGLSDEDYQKYAGRRIDYYALLDNIKYLYKKKNPDVKVYSKIMDYMVEGDERKAKFRHDWSAISDVINIEYLTFMSTSIDYEGEINEVSKQKGLKGFDLVDTTICPLPFYHIYLNAEGTISACCVAGPWSTPPALIMGDLHTQSIQEIWEGDLFREFWIRMLRQGRNYADPSCRECKAYRSYIYPEDLIDNEAERIANELEERKIKKIMQAKFKQNIIMGG